MIERDEYEGPEEDFDDLDELFQGEDEDLENDEETDAELNADRLLAQQELEDFEQADEYFGHFGDEGF
jgi:hypothetical protein